MGPADTLDSGRDTVVVCLVPDAVAPARLGAALAGLPSVTPANAALLLIGIGRADETVLSACHGLEREVAVLESGDHESTGELLHRAAGVTGHGDLVLVSAACRLPEGWLERLRAAALGDNVVATATPMSNEGGTVGVSDGGHPDAAQRIVAEAVGAHPRLLIGGPHCVYVRRAAIELVGGIPPGYGALDDVIAALCERCVQAGLVNVLADDVYVTCESTPGENRVTPTTALMEVDRSDDRSALHRSLVLAASVLTGLTVTIDARALDRTAPGGTQRYTRELVLALARHTDAAVRVVVAPDIAPAAAAQLADAERVQLITYEQAVSGARPTHVVHRPQQVFSVGDLNLLTLLGDRLVITHQDLISYHNPSYHETVEDWEQYRRITRLALTTADRVLFFSEHSRGDAGAEDLVAPDRCEVIGAAVAREPAADPVAPPSAPEREEFILCLGPDYRHKNRSFAIAVIGALRAQHGWPGKLVLAGAHVAHGSSRAQEVQRLGADAELGHAVVDLGSVDEPRREWLLRHARAIIVPSVVEGFGLVPLEAAEAGIPCLFAPQSSLIEVMDRSLATLVTWDETASARNVMPLLADGPPRRLHVEQLRASTARWSWEQIAGQLIGAYERALRAPHRAAAVRAWQELERERYLVELRQRLLGLGDSIALAGPDGFLSASEQRGLLRVGSRPAMRRLTLWPFALLGSIGSRKAPR